MHKWLILLCVLMLVACGADNNNPVNGGGTPQSAAAKDPESAREAVDAYIAAMGTMDTLALKRLTAKPEQEGLDEQLTKLAEQVDKIVITETSFEQKGEYWIFTYSQVAHLKGGKTDGDGRKVVYAVNEDGKWRIARKEPK
ncbi:MAG: hypothetical protein IT464_16135 [Planctomycetes bacterium]|nr:hypothetical protein [Planctomycetota bacterium]